MPTLTQVPAGPAVSDGDGILDLTALEASETAGADSVAGTLAADPVTAPLVLETYLAYRGDQWLVANPTWRHFWMDAGRHLGDWLSSAGSALFGTPSDTVTHEELRLAVNLGVHTGLAATRQLMGSTNGRLRVATTRLVKASNAIAHHVRDNKVIAHSEVLHTDAHARALHQAALDYANARALQIYAESNAYTDQTARGLKTWTIDHVSRPLTDRLDTHAAAIQDLQGAVHNNALRVEAVAGGLAGLGLLVHQMQGQLNKVLTETEECTQPMCETVGPKSDWGKLLKKFAPAAIWALLAELAALHPDAVEAASEDLAHALGPVLERFAEAWIGVLPGGTGGEVKEVEGHVGKFNPLTGS